MFWAATPLDKARRGRHCHHKNSTRPTMPARKIIIDTDPGQDDAVAILLALASPEEIDLLAITTAA